MFTSRALRQAGPIIGDCTRCAHRVRRKYARQEADGTWTHIAQIAVPDAPFAISEERQTCNGQVRLR